jgi:hypothetical protein
MAKAKEKTKKRKYVKAKAATFSEAGPSLLGERAANKLYKMMGL